MLEHIKQAGAHHNLWTTGETLVIGVSGGVDSLVLLHIFCQLRDAMQLTLHVATLNHGLRGTDSVADTDFVRQIATNWGLPVTVGHVDVLSIAQSQRLGIEETARQLRYTFLTQIAQNINAEKIAVGHNQDDQAETVLMHLIRGSGLNGLRGMLPKTPLNSLIRLDNEPIIFEPPLTTQISSTRASPVLIRPLLNTARAEIEAYAATHELVPRYDCTNENTTYFRNRLRHEIIPLLETLNPALRETLARTADVLRSDAELVQAIGATALERVNHEIQADQIILKREVWDSLRLAEKRYVIRAVIWQLCPDLRDITLAHVTHALAIADAGRTGDAATLPGGLLLRVSYDKLIVARAGADIRLLEHDAPAWSDKSDDTSPVFLPGDRVQYVFGAWMFEAEPYRPDQTLNTIHDDVLAAALTVPASAQLRLRTRRAGDRFHPRGMSGRSQKLSDTLINMRVPAVWRDQIPLLTVDDDIAWFVTPTADGLRGRVAEAYTIHEREMAVDRSTLVVCWRHIHFDAIIK